MGDAGPQRISHYAIIRLLNESPVSYTYLGKDEQHKKSYVILKVFNIPLSTTAAKESFLTHAKQLKKLKRSNITEIRNFGIIAEPGIQQDLGYLVIEYIEDNTMRKQFASGKLFAPDEIKPFLSTIADTLQYAHVSHILQTKSSHISLPSRILYNMPMSHIFCMAISIPAISFLVKNCELQISHQYPKSFFSHLII